MAVRTVDLGILHGLAEAPQGGHDFVLLVHRVQDVGTDADDQDRALDALQSLGQRAVASGDVEQVQCSRQI